MLEPSLERSLGLRVGLALVAVAVVMGWAQEAFGQEAAIESPDGAPYALAPSARARAEEREPESSKDRSLGFGLLGGVGFPRVLAAEALIRVDRRLTLGAEYGVFPKTSFGEVSATSYGIAGSARVFPFRGSGFFLGIKGGQQHIGVAGTVSATLNGFTLSARESMSIDAWFVNPNVGYMVMSDSGFALAVSMGVQIPLSSEVATSWPNGTQVASAIENTASSIGRTVLPTVDLLRLGFVF